MLSSRSRSILYVAVLALWCGAAGWFAALRGTEDPSALSRWLAAVAALVIGGVVVAAAGGHLPESIRRRPARAVLVSAPLLLVIVAAAGGVGSSAALLVAAPVLAVAWRRTPPQGAACAAAAIALVIAADVALGRAVDPAEVAVLAAAVVAGGVLPPWYARRMAEEGSRARSRLARVEGYVMERRATPTGSDAAPSDLRRESQLIQQYADELGRIAELERYLRDVREQMGADEVVLWRWSEERSAQTAHAWSTENANAPLYFDFDQWAPLVRWSAEGEVIQCIGDDTVIRFAAAPVRAPGRGRLLGVLSASARAGLTMPRAGAREWMARHAAHAGVLCDLFDVRGAYGRHMRQSRALLRTAERIQEHKSIESLARAICQTAVEVTGGHRAALVRWDPRAGQGEVQSTTEGHDLPVGLRVTTESFLSVQCRLGEPVCTGTIRGSARRGVLYGTEEGVRTVGALAIVPLRRERTVMGAIAVEGESADDLSAGDLKTLSLLAAVAAPALETAWELEEVSRRAHTDPLTGLHNRRYFEEQLSHMFAVSDRYGPSAALIVADLDHFKQVNDTHGHSAGDAVLRHVAQVFRDTIRTVDICARHGGEEMAILLPHTQLAGALDVAERLRSAVAARPVQHAGTEIAVTASFGVASYPEAALGRDGLFPAADRALYQAKAAGRNCVRSAPVISLRETP